MYIKKFKNGNFNVKFESDYDSEEMSILLYAVLNSSELDFISNCEPFSAGNFDCYYELENVNNGYIYIIYGSDIEDYKLGKTVKLVKGMKIIREGSGGAENERGE